MIKYEVINDFLSNINEYIVLYFVSMLPWIEQKAGVLLIANGNDIWKVLLTTFLSSLTIVPVVIIVCKKVINIVKNNKCINTSEWYGKLKNVIKEKVLIHKDKVKKYEIVGLFLIVAFPGTGMWTASMLAGFLGMDIVKSTFFIVLAGTLVGLIYYLGAAGVFEVLKMMFI